MSESWPYIMFLVHHMILAEVPVYSVDTLPREDVDVTGEGKIKIKLSVIFISDKSLCRIGCKRTSN